jgi:inorganic pyrophosphatase
MDECNVIVRIEISQRSRVKYERTESGDLKVDRFLRSDSLSYSFDYGYIENTLSPDGDNTDAIVICDRDLQPNCIIECKIIGVLKTHDEKGRDDKIILVPSESVDTRSKYYNNLDDIRDKLEGISEFFSIYKKTSIVDGFGDKTEAVKIVKACNIYNTKTLKGEIVNFESILEEI